MDIHSAISIAIKNANIGVGVFYVILFAITTVLAYVSVNAINMTLVSQNIDITIWFDVIRNLILIILLMYCRVRTCSVTTTFLWNTRYFLDKVESEKGKFIDKMEKSIHEKGSQAFETLTKEYGKFCKRYSSEAGQTLFYTIILMYRSDKAVFQFVEYICNKYGSNLVELMTNDKEKANKILYRGSDLFEIYKRLIEMHGLDYLDVIYKPF